VQTYGAPMVFTSIGTFIGQIIAATFYSKQFQPFLLLASGLAVSITFSAGSFLLFSMAVFLNRTSLKVASNVCEHLDRLDPKLVFAASFTAFGLATGCMQAFTFFPMPK
jgi:hypothetical protein